MVSLILTQACIALIIFLVLLSVQGMRLFSNIRLIGLFFGVYFADNLLIALTNRFNFLQVIPNHVWEGFLVCNWSGKLYSILFALAILLVCKRTLPKAEAGLTLRQNSGSVLPGSLVILALAGWAFWVGISSPKGKPDLQTLLYLAIMPGLNEELVYRGLLIGAANRIVPPRSRLWAAPFGWGAIVTTLTFSLLHGFWLDANLAVHLDIIALRNAAVSGLIFAWLRERTGSLVLPVAAHGVEDVLFFLPRMIMA